MHHNGRNITTFVASNNNYQIVVIMRKYKVREVIRLLEADGWYELKGNGGDHRQFKHSTKKGRVTVRGKLSETVSQFLLNSIWKQAGWK